MEPSLSRRTWIRVGLCGALVLALALWLRGDFGHFLLALLVGATVWPVSGGLWGLGHWLAARSTRPHDRRVNLAVAAFFAPIFAVASCFVGSWFVGQVVRAHDIEAAERWCEARIDDIERFHALNARYPSKLAEIADVSDGPVLVRDGSAELFSWDGGYSFDIALDVFKSIGWSSTSRRWDG